MGNIGDTISDTIPTVGSAGPTYASTINSLLTEIKARLIAKIPLSSLLTNSDLDMNGQAIIDAAYMTLVNEAVSPVASPANRIAAYGGNIWWVSPSGAVQITAGNQLNASGVGGITGDYSGAGPMEFRYDTANTRYDAFANQSTNTWAYVRARGFDIAGGATSAFRQRHTYNGTSNTALTWTAAAADAGILVVTNNAGTKEISATESIDQFTQTYHATKYKVLSAITIFNEGKFNGAAGSIGVNGDDVYFHRMSTSADYVDVPLKFDNEGSTILSSNPITVTGVRWKGFVNGGVHPTLEVYVTSGTTSFDTVGPSVESLTMGAEVEATGAVSTKQVPLDTPYALTGDETMFVRIIAESNNLDTYYVAAEYTKQS